MPSTLVSQSQHVTLSAVEQSMHCTQGSWLLLKLQQTGFHAVCMTVSKIVNADKEQPLVTSMSADTMHLEAAAVVDIVNMCSGPQGCSVAALLQCIRKGGLQVGSIVSGACKLFCILS